VKILVQNCRTHLYLVSLMEWTPNPEKARNFANSEQALAFCTEHRLPEVQIVLKFDCEKYDISVPITVECDEKAGAQSTLRK
jgi:hypothetical protein